MEKSARLEYVDGLKVVMILCVLLKHLPEYLEIKSNNFWGFWSEWGGAGVSGFIILSGFGLTYSMLAKSLTEVKFTSFFWKRFLRIVPLYYIALFTYLLIVDLLQPQNLLAHVFLIHTFFKDFCHNPGSLWFIGLIIQCYLVFPLAYKLFSQNRGRILLSIAAVFVYALGIILTNNGFYVSDSFLSFVIEFVLGMNLARQAYEGKIKQYSASAVVMLTIIELVCFLTLIQTSLLKELPYYIHFSITTLSRICFFIVILNIFLLLEKRWKHFKRLIPLLSAMSLASYSVYLFHRPILTTLVRGPVWNWVISNRFPNSINFVCLFLISIPLTFLISYWIQKAYDSMQQKFFPPKSIYAGSEVYASRKG